METLVQLGSLTSYALSSNFFGLGCPAHCGAPGLGALIACFLGGLLVGFALCGLVAWVLLVPSLPVGIPENPSPGLQLRVNQLAQYLHAQPRSTRRRIN